MAETTQRTQCSENITGYVLHLPITGDQFAALKRLLWILITNCHQHESRDGMISVAQTERDVAELYGLLKHLPDLAVVRPTPEEG